MIEVNLLPEDRRPVERTPLPRFLAIIVGVVGFCVEGVLLVMILGDFPVQEGKLKDIELRIGAAKDNLAQMKSFASRIKILKTRNKDIKDLYRYRRTWAPLLHRVSAPEVLPRNIWYREIELKQGKAARGKTAVEELLLRGYARGEEDSTSSMFQAAQAVNDFVEHLWAQGEDFTGEFTAKPEKDGPIEVMELSPPKDTTSSVPREAAAFGIKLILKQKKASEAGSKKAADRN